MNFTFQVIKALHKNSDTYNKFNIIELVSFVKEQYWENYRVRFDSITSVNRDRGNSQPNVWHWKLLIVM
jgi:hypothetical protein